MTIYNHQNFLEKAIYSILRQSFKNWELIACENVSLDNSKKILKKFKDKRVKKFFFKKNIGRTNCLNFALKKAKGDYIAIFDSDDLALPQRFKKQFEYLEQKKDIMLLGTWYSWVDEDNSIGKEIKSKISEKFVRKLLFANLIGHSTTMLRRKLINDIGNYPNQYKYMQDYAFFLKIYKKFKIDILPINLMKCRIHHQNSETFRVSMTKIVEKENLKLLNWTKNNFKFSIIEKYYFYFLYLKLKVKILKKKYLN